MSLIKNRAFLGIFSTIVIGVVLIAAPLSRAEPLSNSQPTTGSVPSTQEREKATLEKHIKLLLEAAKLSDPAKQPKLREVLANYFSELGAWHQKNDSQIKVLWGDFNKARSAQDEPKADKVMSQIDDVYAGFKPHHDAFLAELGTLLTPEQIESIKDALTINKVKVTFNAYGQIFHGLTEEQKEVLLKNLKAAREEAINCEAMKEKSAFFKKYKIRIEAYLASQGYDVKKSYQEFVAKLKLETAAKKGAGQPAIAPPENAVENQ